MKIEHHTASVEDVTSGNAKVVLCPECGQMEIWSLAELADHGQCASDSRLCWCQTPSITEAFPYAPLGLVVTTDARVSIETLYYPSAALLASELAEAGMEATPEGIYTFEDYLATEWLTPTEVIQSVMAMYYQAARWHYEKKLNTLTLEAIEELIVQRIAQEIR